MASLMGNNNAGSQLRPLQPGERIEVIDMLRGFALLGILLVNAEFFVYPMQAMTLELPADISAAEYWSWWLIAFAAQGKFYSLFSFLFGLGFIVMMRRAAASDGSGVALFIRRMFVLLVIGVIHGAFIWWGDILTVYALLGFLLLPMRHFQPRTLLTLAIVMLAVPVLLFGLITLSVEVAALMPESAAEMARQAADERAETERLYQQAQQVYATGTYAEITAQRWTDFSTMLAHLPVMGLGILGMFLLGAYFGKRGLLHIAHEHPAHEHPAHEHPTHERPALFRRLLLLGLLVGVPCAMYFATYGMPLYMGWPSMELFWGTVANSVASVLMCLMYVAVFVLLTRNERWRALLAPLASMGRMALTNYLLQSLVWTLVFYGYGLGMFGKASAPVLLFGAIAFWLLQIPLSHWWLRRFRFGPVEWLWRSLTYGRRQPLRLEAQPA